MADWSVGAARDLPINEDKAWDGPAAAKSIFDANSSDGEVTSGARRGFLVYDADNPGNRGSYKLPFAQVINGRLTALASGLRAAASRLPQTDGLSSQTKNAARAVIQSYMSKIHGGDEERSILPYASVVPLERSVGGLLHARDSQADIPEGLLRQLHDPSVVEDTPLYWFRTVASNASEDHYGTIMQPDSLRNYAGDAEDGLPFCNSHQHEELPFGRTYAGRFHQGRGQSLARTEMDVYVPYDMNVNGVDTTHFIKAVRAGVARDVSISFDPDRIVCSLDGRNMPRSILDLLSADPEDPTAPCRHIPGVTYLAEGKKQRALGLIHGAHCLELSPVFRGATPGAAIVSPSRALVVEERGGPPSWALYSPSLRTAALLAEADLLDRNSALALEEHCRGVRFPSVTTRRYAGWSVRAKSKSKDDDNDASDEPDDDEDESPTPATDSNPDPDNDGDDDRTPQGDTDHSHWTASGKKKRTAGDDDQDGDMGMHTDDQRSPAEAELEEDTHERSRGNPTPRGVPAEVQDREDPPASGPPPATRRVREFEELPISAMPSWHADVNRALIASGLAPEDFSGDPLVRLHELGREWDIEHRWAGWGRRYREELCNDVEGEGVRAFGGDGWTSARDAYVPILERGSADDLLALRDHFRKQAAERLRGGRLTTEESDGKEPQTGQGHAASANPRRVPAWAYRS